MTKSYDEIISEIAKKHGVVIGKDDPILMLYTINELLMKENRDTQKKLLDSFTVDITDSMARVDKDSKERAERVLNSAINAGKSSIDESIVRNAKEIATNVNATLKISILDIIDEEIKKMKTLSYINLIGSGMALMAGFFILIAAIIGKGV